MEVRSHSQLGKYLFHMQRDCKGNIENNAVPDYGIITIS